MSTKTTISLPDDVFDRLERAVANLGVSRSELLARAAQHWLDALDAEPTTAAIDRAIAGLAGDAAFTDAAAAGLAQVVAQRGRGR